MQHRHIDTLAFVSCHPYYPSAIVIDFVLLPSANMVDNITAVFQLGFK
jgi:hypothetical protein